jgi:hypothetical protein
MSAEAGCPKRVTYVPAGQRSATSPGAQAARELLVISRGHTLVLQDRTPDGLFAVGGLLYALSAKHARPCRAHSLHRAEKGALSRAVGWSIGPGLQSFAFGIEEQELVARGLRSAHQALVDRQYFVFWKGLRLRRHVRSMHQPPPAVTLSTACPGLPPVHSRRELLSCPSCSRVLVLLDGSARVLRQSGEWRALSFVLSSMHEVFICSTRERSMR